MWRETKTRTKCVFVPVIRTMANAHETETREEDTIPEAEHMELWKNSNNFFFSACSCRGFEPVEVFFA